MHGNPLNNLRAVFEQFLIALQSGQRLPYNLLTKQTASVEIYLLITHLSDIKSLPILPDGLNREAFIYFV